MPSGSPLDLAGATREPAAVPRRDQRHLRLAEDAERVGAAAEPAVALEKAPDAAVSSLCARSHQSDARRPLLLLRFSSSSSSFFFATTAAKRPPVKVLARLQVPDDPFEQAAAGVGQQRRGKSFSRRGAREAQPVPRPAQRDDLCGLR